MDLDCLLRSGLLLFRFKFSFCCHLLFIAVTILIVFCEFGHVLPVPTDLPLTNSKTLVKLNKHNFHRFTKVCSIEISKPSCAFCCVNRMFQKYLLEKNQETSDCITIYLIVWFCRKVYRRITLDLIPREYCQIFSHLQIPYTSGAGFETSQQLTSGFSVWSCLTVAPRGLRFFFFQ